MIIQEKIGWHISMVSEQKSLPSFWEEQKISVATMDINRFVEQFMRECEHDASIFHAEYQSMSDEFKNDVSFDCYLNCVLIRYPEKSGCGQLHQEKN